METSRLAASGTTVRPPRAAWTSASARTTLLTESPDRANGTGTCAITTPLASLARASAVTDAVLLSRSRTSTPDIAPAFTPALIPRLIPALLPGLIRTGPTRRHSPGRAPGHVVRRRRGRLRWNAGG